MTTETNAAEAEAQAATENAARLVADLREAAHFFKRHPELASRVYVEGVKFQISVDSKDELADLVRLFTRELGRVDKRPIETFYYCNAKIGDFGIYAVIERAKVCRKVVRTETVPASPKQVIPARTEQEREVVEWVCDDPLLAPSEQGRAVA